MDAIDGCLQGESHADGDAMTMPDPGCVVKVGDGRGFIIEHRFKVPRHNLPRRLKLRLRTFMENRVVVTAAHCLPKLPLAHAGSFRRERTWKLLGTLGGRTTGIWAECLFVNPVADIAVLGRPDDQEPFYEAEEYDRLTGDVRPLRIGTARSGPGCVLSLRGRWVRTRLELFGSVDGGASLSVDPTEPGMSGSPILNDAAKAIGLISVGSETVGASGERKNVRCGPQPILARDLPGWLIPLSR
jgi:hypothetical protein